MSCCRTKEQDPNIAIFDKITAAANTINARSEEDLLDDSQSNVRWSMYQQLAAAIRKIERVTGKSL